MTSPGRTRVALVVLAGGGLPGLPGLPGPRLRSALAEDVYEVLAGMAGVAPGLAAGAADLARAQELAWPDGRVVQVAAAGGPDGGMAALDVLTSEGAAEGLLVAADAPDVPPLVVAKVFAALAKAQVAVLPADGGGLVGLGAALPAAAWLRSAGVGLDTPDALQRLRAAAPRGALVVGPGWRRLRTAGDLRRLDPGLEGWELTRALLQGRPL